MKIRENEVEELYPITKLSKEELDGLVCDFYYKDQFIKKDDVIYHRKDNDINYIVNELLGELVSNYFSLDTVNGKLYKYFNEYTLLTELFTDSNCRYYFINDLFVGYKKSIYNSFDNLNILNKIKCDGREIDVNKESLKKLLNDIKAMIVRDFITNTKDRHSANFMFFCDKDIVKLMPLYDYEYSFVDGGYRDTNVFSIDLHNAKIIDIFLHDDKFQELLELAMKLDMKKIITLFEEKYPISLSRLDKQDYIGVIKEKQKLIKQYKLLR